MFWFLGITFAICYCLSRNFSKKDQSRIEGQVQEVELQSKKVEVESSPLSPRNGMAEEEELLLNGEKETTDNQSNQ